MEIYRNHRKDFQIIHASHPWPLHIYLHTHTHTHTHTPLHAEILAKTLPFPIEGNIGRCYKKGIF